MKPLSLGILGLSLTANLLSAGSISVIDLGGFGGSSALGFRISDTGSIVGWAQNPTGDTHAFSSAGQGAPLDLNGTASESFAYGVNKSGVIAGTSYSNGQAHGTIWTPNGTVDLGANTYGLDINSSGQVAGGNGQAFIYSNGTMQSLGTLAGGNWSAAYAINDAGAAAGYGTVSGGAFRAFVWTPGAGMSALGTLGGNNSYATGINNQGEVVGHSNIAGGYEHAFSSNGGALQDLGTLGGASSYAYGINNARRHRRL